MTTKKDDDSIHCPVCGVTLGKKGGVMEKYDTLCPSCRAHLELSVDNFGHRSVIELFPVK